VASPQSLDGAEDSIPNILQESQLTSPSPKETAISKKRPNLTSKDANKIVSYITEMQPISLRLGVADVGRCLSHCKEQ
jgi:hypothetical protein